jgi:Acetyltransferase (GNAT) domain
MSPRPSFPRDLGDGLVLRAATAVDAEPLATFVGDTLRAQDGDAPDHHLADWTRDLLEGRHPSFTPADATVVTDTRTGQIVSCLHLVSQTWSYGGVAIPMGQPELIGTRTEHRGHGLVRTQFEIVHGWSAEQRHQLLAIAGIPWFYRQFGYEMAIERGGGPLVRLDALLPLPAPRPGWRVRAAGLGDIAFLTGAGAAAAARSLVSVPRDAALWRYELEGKRRDSAARRAIRILERDGQPVGYIVHAIALFGANLAVMGFEVIEGVSWREAWLASLHDLKQSGEAMAAASPGARFGAISFWFLAYDHPLYRVYRFKERDDGYAWYARVPDVPGFLRTVTPVLERRLAASPCAGHSGALTLGFYRDGVRLTFERGAVKTVEAWEPTITVQGLEFGRASSDPRRPLAMFPDLTFLQLLFGFRSLEALEAAFPDCVVRTQEARALLEALFPRSPSDVWPVI